MAAVSVAVSGVTLALAQPQPQAESPLQGRILQRSDGILYVYADGYKYRVQPAPLDDDEIAAIPEAGPPVERVDRFFFPPTPTPVPPPPPIATPRPKPGDVLYQADWSGGLNGWAASSEWKTVSGMLVNDGTRGSIAFAPYVPEIPDYAVEAEIQWPQQANIYYFFGVALRYGDGDVGYKAGAIGASLSSGKATFVRERDWAPGSGWHTYRAEARGNTYRLLIDGRLMVEATDNRSLSPGRVGVFTETFGGAPPINVRSFKVIAV